ncbi:MAG: hypothetical protein P4K83_12160 [Terracidiphilus sp.]|nr:hypothetical protein [Terracidiphilus sp.]
MGLRIALALAAAIPLCAQYPGQLAKSTKDTPTLRAISVLEWTGDEAHPKASRLIPVTIFDGQTLQEADVYLARPEPLSVAGDVEYELQRNGLPIGLYEIKNAGQEQGAWVGYGAWKSVPAPKPKTAAPLAPLNPSWNDPDDRPVLHRKHHPDDPPAKGDPQTQSGSAGAKSSSPAPAADPDRPTLHKKTPDATPAASPDNSASASSADPAPDPDRPTLRKKSQTDDQASGKKKKGKNADVGHVDSLPSAADPDRPKLKRGKPEHTILNVLPSLIGMPPDLNQAVAVSDNRDLAQHPWTFAWSDPTDQDKTKASLQQIARDALGLTPPPAPSAPAKRTSGRKPAKSIAPPPPPPAPLVDENFHVFELAYGAGATFVYSAHTGGKGVDDKHITLIAQPDLYGNVLVLLKSVTDAAHFDAKPRMRLIDAVDALSDNRGELLFELRGHTERQFVLYRVVRGQAERIFSTNPADIVVPHGS